MFDIAAVILNWRGASDTVACVQSLIATRHPLDLIVVDNHSGDSSLEQIEGALASGHNVSFSAETHCTIDVKSALIENCRIRLVQSGRNGGYSFGNNVGIRLVLEDVHTKYVWILNNDILVPDRSSIAKLIEKMNARPDVGICGSTVVYANNRTVIQTRAGGHFLSSVGRSVPLGWKEDVTSIADENAIEARLSYVNGAAMLIRRQVFEDVGLLEERYFLYYEELDFAKRAAKYWTLGYASQSLLYHAVGASIGTSDNGGGSPTSAFYLARSRLMFLRVFHPNLVPIAVLDLLKACCGMVLRGRRRNAIATARGVMSFTRLFFEKKDA